MGIGHRPALCVNLDPLYCHVIIKIMYVEAFKEVLKSLVLLMWSFHFSF